MIQVTVVGRLGSDPELRYTSDQKAVCSMNVASTEKYGNQENTTWCKLSFWNQTAETVANYFKKGDQIIAIGRGSVESFETQSGKTITNLKINVSSWEFGAKSNPQPAQQKQQQQRKPVNQRVQQHANQVNQQFDANSEEIPF